MNILPWQISQWENLQSCRVQQKLPHALLFTGAAGVGKYNFTLEFAHSLLCGQNCCGSCKSCKLFEAGHHPDLKIIEPVDDKAIKVDEIRNIVSFVNYSAHVSSYKIVIINVADKMNLNAANALLKTLEEPNKKIILILVTNRPMSLPATIRSRCQTVFFPAPKKEVALKWLESLDVTSACAELLLEFAHGAPLKVLDFVKQDLLAVRQEIFQAWCELLAGKVALVSVSQAWQKLDVAQVLFHLTSWITDLIRLRSNETIKLINFDFAEQLKSIAKKFEIKNLYKFYDDLIAAQNLLHSSCNLNPQLVIENLLVGFVI
ncbi:MAG: DNA polymerase III subunit delta' [Gammaproteobacteria bacterium]|jgi:DNA polymerase-3 subunit delta'